LYRETINLGTDRDFFKISAPAAAGGSSYTLSAVAWGEGLLGFAPIVHVYSATGAALPVQVLANDSGTYSIQIANATPNSVYYVEVQALNPGLLASALSNYTLFANFSTASAVALANLGGGTLTQSAPQATASLVISSDELFHFVLDATSASSTASVTMTVTDQNGNTILTMNAVAGQAPVTDVTLLHTGTYTITYSTNPGSNGAVSPINFWLLGEVLSYEQGAYYTCGSGNSSSGGGGYVYTGPSGTSTGPKTY
jgi:hypothetical protein